MSADGLKVHKVPETPNPYYTRCGRATEKFGDKLFNAPTIPYDRCSTNLDEVTCVPCLKMSGVNHVKT